MQIKRKATILYISDLKRAKKFYTEILGFEPDMDFSSVIFFKNDIAIWQLRDNDKLNLELGEGFYKTKSNKFELYFEVTEFQDLVNSLKENDVKLLHDVHTESHGQKTIRFFDPDMNIIEIGETLEEFIKRDYDEGMNLDELSKKHTLSVQEIKELLDL